MRNTSARPGGDRRNARPGRPGSKNTGKSTGREARSDRPHTEGRPFKKDRPFSKERPYSKDRPESGDRKFSKDKPFSKDRPKTGDRKFSRERPYSKDRPESGDRTFSREKPFSKDHPATGDRKFSREKPFSKDRPATGDRKFSREKPFSKDRPQTGERRQTSGRPKSGEGSGRGDRSYSSDRPYSSDRAERGERSYSKDRPASGRPYAKSKTSRSSKEPRRILDDSSRLNKFIANAGVCSRREADMLIKNGAITVNGEIVTEMGIKVKPGDVVMYGTQRLINEKKVYILLNKPKDYITTSDDPQDRKTVLELIRNAGRERVYPVGRLDRNTTGLLLLTNDGELAKKLTHPRHGVRKLYHVHLDQAVTKADLEQIAKGVKIEDNLVVPDAVSYIDKAETKKEVGIELHSGQNRVVRRLFEQFGYKVTKLDRVVFAGLTKKDLPRGKWRFLTEKEVNYLRMLG